MAILNEPVGLMEPLLPSEGIGVLEDLTIDLVSKSSQLRGSLNPLVAQSIGDLVRSMNCYYSNLIEGHDTHPRSIDQALANNYDKEPEKRNLQLEAVAHIAVQKMIDNGQAPDIYPLTAEYATWIHKEFCSRLPEELLWARDPDTGKEYKVMPGELRDHEVKVGEHFPPVFENLPMFLARFNEAYSSQKVPRYRRAISTAAAHHRFLWIHPFADGNGRVTRLMSYAALLHEGIGNPLWSVARGLARKVTEYKALLKAADLPRRGERDGRGNLSQETLIAFCEFFLNICIDQVEYMKSLIQPEEFLRRLRLYADDKISANQLPKGSFEILREVFLLGEMERGKAAEVTGFGERTAREVVSKLYDKGLLTSETPKSAVTIAFPFDIVERVFPTLYPN